MHTLHKLRDTLQLAVRIVIFERPVGYIILELPFILEFPVLIFLPYALFFPIFVRDIDIILREQHKRYYQTAYYGE